MGSTRTTTAKESSGFRCDQCEKDFTVGAPVNPMPANLCPSCKGEEMQIIVHVRTVIRVDWIDDGLSVLEDIPGDLAWDDDSEARCPNHTCNWTGTVADLHPTFERPTTREEYLENRWDDEAA